MTPMPRTTDKTTGAQSALRSAFRLSIGMNIVLIGALGAVLWRRLPVAASAPTAIVHADAPKTVTAAKGTQPRPDGLKLTPSAIAQLERTGISRDVLINVLLQDFSRRWDKRVLALQKKYAPKLVPDREMRDLSRESDAEQARELKESFGEEGYRAWDKEQTLLTLNRARLPGDALPMTDDEAEQAYQLQKQFDEKSKDLQLAMEDGVADKADAGALQARAQEALDSDLRKLLGDQRFSELRGNTDPTAEVYQTLGDLNPTPDQATAAAQAEADYRARAAALAAQQSQNPANAADVTSQLQAINDAREANLRQIFGADAYDAMRRQNDSTYQTLQQFAGIWNFNAGDVQQVYASVHDFQQQADSLRAAAQLSEQAGQHVDWNAVNASIDQALQQTEVGLQNTIGPDGLRHLTQNGLLSTR
jgi:hypothetical protein